MVQDLRSTLAQRVLALPHQNVLLEVTPDVGLAVPGAIPILGSNLSRASEPLLQVDAAPRISVLLEALDLAVLEKDDQIRLSRLRSGLLPS